MSIVLARQAFTAAGKGLLQLNRLDMRTAPDGNNSQVMEASGFNDGVPFEVSSGPVDPRTAPQDIARELAAKVLAQSAALGAHLDTTIAALKSGAPLAAPQQEVPVSDPIIPEGAAPAPQTQSPAPPPAAAEPAKPADLPMPRTPELNALVGNFGMLTLSVEAMAARVNRRMAAIADEASKNGDKFDRAIDPVEAMVKVVGDAADKLSNGGPQ